MAINTELLLNWCSQWSTLRQEVAGDLCLSERCKRHNEAAGGDTVKAPSTLVILPVPQAPCSQRTAFSHKAAVRHPGYHRLTLWIPSGCFTSPPSTLVILPVHQAPCSQSPAFSHKATARYPVYHCPTFWIPSGCFSSPSSPGSQTTPDPYHPAPQSTLLLHFRPCHLQPPKPPLAHTLTPKAAQPTGAPGIGYNWRGRLLRTLVLGAASPPGPRVWGASGICGMSLAMPSDSSTVLRPLGSARSPVPPGTSGYHQGQLGRQGHLSHQHHMACRGLHVLCLLQRPWQLHLHRLPSWLLHRVP